VPSHIHGWVGNLGWDASQSKTVNNKVMQRNTLCYNLVTQQGTMHGVRTRFHSGVGSACAPACWSHNPPDHPSSH